MTTILIHGPQGCGKTRNAQALAAHFGCSKVVDDWNGRDRVVAGALVLTNIDNWKASALPTARRVVPFAKAMREAGLAQ
jgi:MoxR-like ATPase